MNLQKAIEIKKRYQYILQDASLPELIEADNLSIEALELIEQQRLYALKHIIPELPSETDD